MSLPGNMTHPFLSATQIGEDLSIDEMQSKISELTRKLGVAYQTQNQSLIAQLSMAISTYQEAYAAKLNAAYGNNGTDYQDKIDIS